MTNPKITRREAIAWTAATAGAMAAPALALREEKRIPIGLQLYSVRDVGGKDFDGMLKQVAEMGFEGVEFAGYGKYGKDPEGLRKKLDELKLVACGTHIGAGSFEGAKLKETIAFHKTIGCKFLIVPGDGRFFDPVKSKDYAEFLNKTAEALKPEGLFCGHHNHDKEHTAKDGDKSMWDHFAERTSKDVILQNDVGHTRYAGLDPVDVLKKHPGRTKSIHVKDRLPKDAPPAAKPFVGQGTIRWKELVTVCYEVAGTEWFVIEQENYPDKLSSMECTKISLDGFKKILKEMGK
jgi:sugar phosphate isomerase/epimerase